MTAGRVGPGRRAGPLVAAMVLAGLGVAACNGIGAPGPVAEGTLETGDATLGWVRVGEGPAHVVVHGGPSLDHRYLRPGMDALARGRSLVYYDMRGLGSSMPDSGTVKVTWQGALEDLDAMADRFADEEGKVGVVAHSWGSRPALAWALEHPEKVRSLVLVSPVEPGNRFAAENRQRQLARTNAEVRTELDSLVANAPSGWRNDPEYRSRVWRAAFQLVEPDPDVIDELDLVTHPVTARRGDVVAVDLGGTGGGEDLSLWDRLGGLDAPVLVVHGSEDVGAPNMARELADSLPGGRAVVLDGVGHFPWVAAPERFVEVVDTFLTRTERR